MFVEVDKCKYIFKALEIIFDSLIYFGLLERVFVLLYVFFHISCDLFNVSQIHVCSNETFYHLIVEKKVHKFKINFLFKFQIIF